MRQVAAISSPSADACRAGHFNWWRSMSVSRAGCGSEKSQAPPASHAQPSRHCPISSGAAGRFTSLMVSRFAAFDAQGRSLSEVAPGPGVISVGHCGEPKGTAGGRIGVIPRFASSARIAVRASPPISSKSMSR